MNFIVKLSARLLSTAIIICQTTVAIALDESEIENIATDITIQIVSTRGITAGRNFPIGSGVLISKEGDTYYVLTNNHIVKESTVTYFAIARGRRDIAPITVISRHNVENDNLENVDLAELTFTSNQDYNIANPGASIVLRQGTGVYVAGWPISDPKREKPKFTSGRITNEEFLGEAGQPLTYSNDVENGMSGGPVLNQKGELIGIHKGSIGNNPTETERGGQGIRIETIRETVASEQIKKALVLTPTLPPELNQPPNQPPVILTQPPANEPVPTLSVTDRALY